jgi:hypothetical protein
MTEPHLLACAIMAYSRKSVNLTHEWCWELELLTGSSLKDFEQILRTLDLKYQSDFPSETTQSPPPQKLQP